MVDDFISPNAPAELDSCLVRRTNRVYTMSRHISALDLRHWRVKMMCPFALAMAASGCGDSEPTLPPRQSSAAQVTRTVVDQCASLYVSTPDRSIAPTASLELAPGCHRVLTPEIVGEAEWADGELTAVRVPIAIRNLGQDTVVAPAWVSVPLDSVTGHFYDGSFVNWSVDNVRPGRLPSVWVSSVDPDSAAQDQRTSVWHYTAPLAANGDIALAPGKLSSVRWITFRASPNVIGFSAPLRTTAETQPTTSAPSAFPVVAPDSIPLHVYDDTNLVALVGPPSTQATSLRHDLREVPNREASGAVDETSVPFIVRDLLIVGFNRTSTYEERAAAVAHVGGTVIGGTRAGGDDGLYWVQVPGGSTPDSLFAVANTLDNAPGVAVVSPEVVSDSGALAHLRPQDDKAVGPWTVSLDSSTSDANWAYERVGAPLAWGCSTGSHTTPVAVVDAGFATEVDLGRNITRGPEWEYGPVLSLEHGLQVSSVLAASGNNGVGIAGMMWDADLRLYSESPLFSTQRFSAALMVSQVMHAGRDGARVINLSSQVVLEPTPNTSAQDLARLQQAARRIGATLSYTLDVLGAEGKRPLVVLAAGNIRQPVNYAMQQRIDAMYAGFPLAAQTHPDQVMVVGASTTGDNVASFSYTGGLVSVVAPGVGVLVVDHTAKPFQNQGTSFAAPIVAGIAGELFAFDPRLTAEEVRRLILNGAARGGRRAGTYPIVNAYRSLQLAAMRTGAPVCGNRIWSTGHDLVIERDSATGRTETIPTFSTAEYVSYIAPVHGGKQIYFYTRDPNGDAGDHMRRADLSATYTWSIVPDALAEYGAVQSSPSVLRGNQPASTYYAWGGTTHDGDSTAYFEAQYPPHTFAADTALTLRSDWWLAGIAPENINALSIWLDASNDPAMGIGTGRKLADLPVTAGSLKASAFNGTSDRAYSAIAFDPTSNYVYVGVVFGAGDARIFRLDRSKTNQAPTLLGTLTGDYTVITYMSVSEDGRQIGFTYSDIPIDGPSHCVIEYRDTRNFSHVLRRLIPVPDINGCDFAGSPSGFSSSKSPSAVDHLR